MAERRSLGDAMQMTPEKLAFIQGQSAKRVKTSEPAPKPIVEKAVEIPAAEGTRTEDGHRAQAPRKRGRTRSEKPEAGEILDQVRVPVTVRLPHRIAQALRRAHLEQRLHHAKPDTQQEIAEEAISEWLKRNDFLD